MKEKKNLFRTLIGFMLMLTLVLSMGVTPVFAADYVYSTDSTGADATQTISDPAKYEKQMTSGTLSIYRFAKDNTGALKHDRTYYFDFDSDGVVYDVRVQDNTGHALPNADNPFTKLKLSGAQQAADAIQDIKDLTNVHADLSAAQGTLEPIVEIVNTVIGILATAILILVGLFTAIDILYLEVPAFHTKMDDKGMEKGSTNKSGGVKHPLISEDASQAFQEASENGKNPLIVYLKKRVVAYVAVAIVLYMLLSGNLSLIVEVVLKMLNGVFGWVEDYSATM